MDLHAEQIQGFFDIPVDNVYASPVLLGDAWKQGYQDMVVVSPDVGGVVRARALAKRLDDAELAIIDKRRPRPNESKVMNIIGEVRGKTCVMIDDMVDTAGTLCQAAQALKDEGREARGGVHHAPGALRQGRASASRTRCSTSSSSPTRFRCARPRRQCGRSASCRVAGLLAETIRRIRDEESVSSLYID